jgi:putative membrane protein
MKTPVVLLAATLLILVWSGIHPHDRFTWILEVLPFVIALPILVGTARRLPLTPLAYTLIAIHATILMVGGHYTYAQVPLGFWMQQAFGLSRNHYDRIGHLAQGFVPVLVAREILVRRGVVTGRRWLSFLVVCFALAFSAFYELIEWWTALATGEAATAFLGTQGDPWDTQWDMCMALIGSIASLTLLSRLHDRHLAALSATSFQHDELKSAGFRSTT